MPQATRTFRIFDPGDRMSGVVLPRGLAAEDVRRAPQVGFEVLERKFHWLICSRTVPRFITDTILSKGDLEDRVPAS